MMMVDSNIINNIKLPLYMTHLSKENMYKIKHNNLDLKDVKYIENDLASYLNVYDIHLKNQEYFADIKSHQSNSHSQSTHLNSQHSHSNSHSIHSNPRSKYMDDEHKFMDEKVASQKYRDPTRNYYDTVDLNTNNYN